MPIDYDRLMQLDLPPLEQTYTERDTILYALGVGLGSDPLDRGQLQFVYEQSLAALPSMAAVLGYVRIKDLPLGIDYLKLVHGEQCVVLHRPLPVSGTIVCKTRITDILDRGADKGAAIYLERTIREKDSGEQLATVMQMVIARGDGGFSAAPRAAPPPHTIPDRAPDIVCDLPTLPQQALIYRLSGDINPLHADPDVARKAGFERPILHGLATFGLVCHAALKAACGYDAARLLSLEGRFSAPVFPGDSIRTEVWVDGDAVSLRARVPARDVVVFNNGLAKIRP